MKSEEEKTFAKFCKILQSRIKTGADGREGVWVSILCESIDKKYSCIQDFLF